MQQTMTGTCVRNADCHDAGTLTGTRYYKKVKKMSAERNMQIPFSVMAKPMGPVCNLDCTYCYYLEKRALYDDTSFFCMKDEVLREYIRQYSESQQTLNISFLWQGGEPMLAGLDFFRKALEMEKKYSQGKKVENSLQTNATLITDEWASFFAQNNFLVGVSIDGPAYLHDRYRKDKQGKSTHADVVQGIRRLQAHKAEYNALVTVNRANMDKPLEVYRHLKDLGVKYMQFIPLVERSVDEAAKEHGLHLAAPPQLCPDSSTPRVTAWSARPYQYGEFLCTIFDEWLRNDIADISIQIFDVALRKWMRMPDALCMMQRRCGHAMLLEHNGDLYSCDHYVYPEYLLGNIMETPIQTLAHSAAQQQFGAAKEETLPRYCRECSLLWLCRGGCPKGRIRTTPDGERGLNYFCASYTRFFTHSSPYMQQIASLLQQRIPPSQIQQHIRQKMDEDRTASAGRNDPCPCGSGRKYKNCCGRKT